MANGVGRLIRDALVKMLAGLSVEARKDVAFIAGWTQGGLHQVLKDTKDPRLSTIARLLVGQGQTSWSHLDKFIPLIDVWSATQPKLTKAQQDALVGLLADLKVAPTQIEKVREAARRSGRPLRKDR